MALLLVAAGSAQTSIGAESSIRANLAVSIPMRDGVKLAADIYRPAAPGRYAAILDMTPYDRSGHGRRKGYEYWVRHGYAFIVVDVRGRGDSEGQFDWFYNDINDGYDAVEWIATQPWSTGRVGMIGASYTGTNQWFAARNRPPHLKCITPSATAGEFFNEIPYQGGAFRLEWNLTWINQTSDRIQQAPLQVNWKELLSHRPLRTADEAAGRMMPLYRRFLEHPTLDAFWQRIQFTEADFRKLDIPALAFTGWFDGTMPGTIFYYKGMKKHSPASGRQYLVIGPWVHGTAPGGGRGATKVADLEFPKHSLLPGQEILRAFYDSCLRDGPKFEHPSAKIYLTGSNRWLDLPDYPPPQMQVQPLYLHSGGKANTRTGDGRLNWDAPHQESPDQFTYNPANPVPSLIEGKEPPPGNPIDHSAVESRPDVLVYTSEILAKPLTIAGNVSLVLHAASDARDTDFTANLLDVYPDGRAIKLGPKAGGALRARYRNGYGREELLTPNRPAEFRIDLFDMGHTFLPGHRVRLEVSSSLYPWISANPNTGKPIATDVSPPQPARQRVFHEAARASRLLLPVLPEPPEERSTQ